MVPGSPVRPLSLGLAALVVLFARPSPADERAPLFVPPVLTRFVEAAAPPSLATRRDVDVVLSLDVDDKGAVTHVELRTSAGGDDAGAYDDAALAAAKQFEFVPGTADGKPVPVQITYRYRFLLKPAAPPAPAPSPTAPPAPPSVPVSGLVRRAGDRTPLSGVSITVDDLDTLTDADGRFALPAVPVGPRVFKLRSGEIAPADQKLELHEGKRAEVVWYVSGKERYTSTVRGKRVVQETVEYSLSGEEVRRIPGTQGDTLKAIQNLPGVARAPFGGGQIAVWGSSPGDTRTYVDGVQIPVLFHFGGLRSTISSEIIEDLHFLPGGYSADYGRGLGGVIQVETKRPRTDGIHGFVQLDLIDGSLMLEGKITKNLSFSVGARRSWIDAFVPLFTTSDFQLSPIYYDYQGRLSWRASPRDDVDVLLFGSDDVLKLGLKQADPALSAAFDSHTFYHRALVRWTHRFADRATLTITPSAGYDVPFRVDATIGNTPFQVDARLATYNLRAVARIPVTSWLRLDAGLDFEGERWDIRALAPAAGQPREGDAGMGSLGAYTSVDTTFYLHKVGPYAIADFTFLDKKLSIAPQIRLDTYVWSSFRTGTEYNHGHFQAEPRLQLRYQVHPKVALKLAVGKYSQAPDPTALLPGFGNPAVKPPSGLHYVAGIEARPWTGGLVQVQLFYKDLSDLLVRGRTAFDPLITNNGRGRVYGADLFIRQELWKGFFGWISYTVSRSERKDDADEPWRVFRLDQTHIFTLIASYKLPRGFQLGLRFRVVTGNPVTPVRAAYFDNNDGSYTPLYGNVNADRLATFHQLDLRLDKSFTFKWWKLSIYLDIQNLYYAKNPEALAYSYDYAQSQPITGLPILPVFGIRGDF